MVSATSGGLSVIAATDFTLPKVSAAGSTDPFAQQLLSAMEGYLDKGGNGAHLQIDIQAAKGQNSGDRQFIVTVKNSGTDESTGASNTTVSASGATLMSAHTNAVAATTTTTTTVKAADKVAIDKSNMTPDEAYWAEQPPEIQALHRCATDEELTPMAVELAATAFPIHFPILV